MLGIGQKLPKFEVTGVKPGFQHHEEKGVSAFEPVTDESFPGKWKIIFFYPKDFTFVCPTEIAEFARLSGEFADRDAVVLGGSTDNEFVKLAWRRDHKDLAKLPIWQFADTKGSLVDGLGVRAEDGDRASLHVRRRSAERRSSTSTRRTTTSAARPRTRCASSTPCRRTSCARATAKSAATR